MTNKLSKLEKSCQKCRNILKKLEEQPLTAIYVETNIIFAGIHRDNARKLARETQNGNFITQCNVCHASYFKVNEEQEQYAH
jgi:hypothetical protein